MASYSVSRSKTATLVASTVDTVTITDDASAVEVVNLDGAAEIYILVDSGGTNPTVEGDNCRVLPATIGSLVIPAPTRGASTVVKLISAGTPKYHVGPAS